MRIAFVVNNYPPRVGGVETHVASLAGVLGELGHDVIVYTLGDPVGEVDENGIVVVRRREYTRIGGILGFPALGTTRWLAADLRRRGVGVVSVHTRFFPMSWVGMRAGRKVGATVVHTEHGSGHVVSPSFVVRWGSRFVDRTFGRAVLRGSDAVLGVSEQVVDFVRRLSGVSARVFYNAIRPPTSAPRPIASAGRLVFVGRLVPGKGWEEVLGVVARLRASGHEVTADVLGDGADRAAAERMVADLGLSDVVTIHGRVDSDRVRERLAGATLVNPTVLAEGFQTTLLEALAEGGRVVTYDVPGAAVLRAQGHPVEIVAERSVPALVDAVERAIAAGPVITRGEGLEQWFWPARAREYVEICTTASARERR